MILKFVFPLLVAGCTGIMAVVRFAVRDPDSDPRVQRLCGIGYVFTSLGCLALARYQWLLGLQWPYRSKPLMLTGMVLVVTGAYFQGHALLTMMPDEVAPKIRRTVVGSFHIAAGSVALATLALISSWFIGLNTALRVVGLTLALLMLCSLLIGGSLCLLKVNPIIRAKQRERRAQRESGEFV